MKSTVTLAEASAGFMNGAGLQRIVGVRALALMIVSITVGAGIFGMPAIAARDLGQLQSLPTSCAPSSWG